MTVFLRWGVFGLLAISALIYAYRVNERSDDIRLQLEQRAEQRRAAERELREAARRDVEFSDKPAIASLSSACEEAVQVAVDAAAAAKAGQPLDRVLRQERIAWQDEPVRKQRLAVAARLGYSLHGQDGAAIRRAVADECRE